MDKEKLFKEFLNEYLGNVKKELPQSYRAQQLAMGGDMARLVEEFETKFLKEPFMSALKRQKQKVKEFINFVLNNSSKEQERDFKKKIEELGLE